MALASGQKAQAQLLLLNDADPVLPENTIESSDPVSNISLRRFQTNIETDIETRIENNFKTNIETNVENNIETYIENNIETYIETNITTNIETDIETYI